LVTLKIADADPARFAILHFQPSPLERAKINQLNTEAPRRQEEQQIDMPRYQTRQPAAIL
jgi:hypothetical protein